MINDIKNRFEYYLFGRDNPYEKYDAAIVDLECFEIAKQIIALEDTFILQMENTVKEREIEHYEEVYTFLVEKFGKNCRLVRDVQKEIHLLKEGFYLERGDRASYADDILRIRATFDMYGQV